VCVAFVDVSASSEEPPERLDIATARGLLPFGMHRVLSVTGTVSASHQNTLIVPERTTVWPLAGPNTVERFGNDAIVIRTLRMQPTWNRGG
jgi:hypothetical protein